MASLTRALYGEDLPKQFAVLDGEQSLMQQTIERALRLTVAERILVVVAANRAALARKQLAPYPGVELVVQPRNLDTGPGLLLPLVRILSRTWNAHVIFLPSDHYVSNAIPLVDALVRTRHGELRDRLTLIGVMPTGPEVEYGWIVRGAPLNGSRAFAVVRFEEKPPHALAEDLWQAGGLWNTFISAGPVHVFWELARRHLARHAAVLERYAVSIGGLSEAQAPDDAYRAMTPANFSREVLANAPSLAVLPVCGSGWSDWGSPRRVFASLVGTPSHDRLVRRIRGDIAMAC